jgi:hypothetical protein
MYNMSLPDFIPKGTSYNFSEEKIHEELGKLYLEKGDIMENIKLLDKKIRKLAEDDSGTDNRRLGNVKITKTDDEMREWLISFFDIGKNDLATDSQKGRLVFETERAIFYRICEELDDRISRKLGDLDRFGTNTMSEFIRDGVTSRDAQLYSMVKWLEIRLRSIISHCLLEDRMTMTADDEEWWEKRLGSDIKNKIKDGKNSEKSSERKFQDVEYLDFTHYVNVIIKKGKNWKMFGDVFGRSDQDKSWLETRLNELRPIRNIIIHRPPLGKEDEKRFRLFWGDIMGRTSKAIKSQQLEHGVRDLDKNLAP